MNYKLLLRDASLTLFTQIITAVSGVLVMFIISRKFGLESYGEFYLVKRVSDVLWLFFLLGMTVSIPRNKAFIDKTRSKGSAEFSFLVFPIISTFLYILFSNELLALFLKDLKNELDLIVSLLIIGMVFYSTVVSYLRAIAKFIILNINTFINFSIIPLIPLLYANNIISYLKIYSLVLLIFNVSIYIIISLVLLLKYHPFKQINEKIKGLMFFLKYGTLRLPGLFLASLIFTLPITILNYLGSTRDIGTLAQIFQLFGIISMPINALGIILLPNFSKIIAVGNSHSLNLFIKRGIKLTFITSSLIALTLSVFIEEIIYIINGVYIDFENLVLVKILIFTIVPYSIYNFLRNPIDAAHETPYSTILVLFSFILSTLSILVIYNFTKIFSFNLIVLFTTLNLFY